MNSIEKDCPQCDEGVLVVHFWIQPAEPDVGIPQGYTNYDGVDPCDNCGTEPDYTDPEIERLEEEATEKLLRQDQR